MPLFSSPPICYNCKHYDMERSVCSAFPIAIPEEILYGDNDHSKIHPEQAGDAVYEPKKEKRWKI
jgi:hypothetical protein